jgi:coniferyl-aldehyde dehydrogenase
MMRLTGGRAELQFQPLGVVGNISPWNFPVELAFSPAIGALAAGNRVMLKPSELTPQTSALIEEMVSSAFDPAEMAVVTGGVDVAQEFSQLPFDHLVFTGGPEIAKHVMRAAADNLVPLTLELGGKCPVVVGRSADIKTVADRVMGTKTINSGQLCLCYESLADNPDHTAVINERHWQRLRGYIDDLESRKVHIEVFNPAQESFDDPQKHKLPFVMPIEPDDDSLIMQDEIFGPMNKPRPLALYYFGKDKREIEALCQRTTSGGVTINDCAQHAACYDLPLAGVGNSGMGGYHGHHGFLQFSHKKAVYRQGLLSLGKFIRPPYSGRKMKLIDSMI